MHPTAAANLEIKSKAPNGVNYTVKGKSAHDKPLVGSVSIFWRSMQWNVAKLCSTARGQIHRQAFRYIFPYISTSVAIGDSRES